MSLMGWSSAEMAAPYQHVTDTIRQDVARQVDSPSGTCAAAWTLPIPMRWAKAAGRLDHI